MTTVEEAAEVLQKERLDRAERCNEGIAKLLESYKCRINGRPFIDDEGRVRVQVEIVAL